MHQQENTLIPQSSSPLNAPEGIFVTFPTLQPGSNTGDTHLSLFLYCPAIHAI